MKASNKDEDASNLIESLALDQRPDETVAQVGAMPSCSYLSLPKPLCFWEL